jgi:hypothetical protein
VRQEGEEEHHAEEHQPAEDDQAEVGGVALADAAQQHERVGEVPEQGRQDRLQQRVPVEQPHVPRRELTGGRLDQEHRHGGARSRVV